MKNFINPIKLPKDDPGRYLLDDKGVGNAFADLIKNKLRFVADEKCWFNYTNVVWKKDHNSLCARESVKHIWIYEVSEQM